MPNLSIQDSGGVIGHQSCVSVAHVSELFNFKKSNYRLINKYDNEGIVQRISGSCKHHNKTSTEVEHK